VEFFIAEGVHEEVREVPKAPQELDGVVEGAEDAPTLC
jgi:hypothetical protein